MRISVVVKPFSSIASVEQIDKATYRVRVHEKPTEGKANDAVIKLLADFFEVPKSSIAIVSGKTAKKKIIDIHSLP